jgi:hypothetical protein
MKSTITSLFVLIATLPAISAELDAEWCERIQPPPALRQPVTVPYEVIDADPKMVKIICGLEWMPPDQVPGGCVKRGSFGEWEIWINRDIVGFERECLLGHERGHLPPNNWRHRPPHNAFQDVGGSWRPRIGPPKRNHR